MPTAVPGSVGDDGAAGLEPSGRVGRGCRRLPAPLNGRARVVGRRGQGGQLPPPGEGVVVTVLDGGALVAAGRPFVATAGAQRPVPGVRLGVLGRLDGVAGSPGG
ncbi:hypothetical protein DMB42_52085 [Nonomuraea sp. WAC 01424]|nr:hypothetical protein DMB42_52085 [Nonomuraea sp. WAC 01424]